MVSLLGISQSATSYTITWKLDYSLPFSPQKYTDVAFQVNNDVYPIGRFNGKYIPIDKQHPFFSRLPQNAFIALKEVTNDTSKVIYACQENGSIHIYEHSPKKDFKDAVSLKKIELQTKTTTDLPQNVQFTWQFEEFTRDNLTYTNLLVIINQKQYKIGIYEGKCNLLDNSEIQKNYLPNTIYSAVKVKDIIIAVEISEKECTVHEKLPNQELKLLTRITL
ncbi:MAG: hypothetical protein NZ455_15510 [Bacteroidia bacterium]|nr:hypothetical protein [Bacteroidia bacterium]MDW8346832.1 hypothetical protein [Bacteroidia bacterium]